MSEPTSSETRHAADGERIASLVADAHALLDEAIEREVYSASRSLAGIVILFSGGNDSTTLAHLFKGRATNAAHANTGIGIEQTRQYVRDTCAGWGLPLIEAYPRIGETYRDLVLGRVRSSKPRKRPDGKVYPGGFPGPAMHFVVYQRLKERALEQVRRELVEYPYRQRVIFLAGRRADESGRRKGLGSKDPIERRGSTVWVSPLVNWTKADLNAYRRVYPDVPNNEVSDLLHMSGECLCGAFAHAGELEEIEMWFPDVVAEIRQLEKEVAAGAEEAEIPAERCRWGWGAGKEKPSKVGDLCSSCDARFEQPLLPIGDDCYGGALDEVGYDAHFGGAS
jgi:3'-phosphoadenosine 5'-phosphosulfate sulfotransferase (PAPS reductase)/FAD synthetase